MDIGDIGDIGQSNIQKNDTQTLPTEQIHAQGERDIDNQYIVPQEKADF
jgi:hypothetical protein